MKFNKISVLFFFAAQAHFCFDATAQTVQTNSDAVLAKDCVWSVPTNNISVGVRYFTNQTDVLVYLTDVGPTNDHQLWIAPPEFQRVELSLYDSSRKVVPHLVSYRPNNKIYKNVSDVPKNIHNVYIGLMGPPFSLPYEQLTLGNVFQIEHSGDYKLVAKGRILKINDDSSLSVIEFPPVILPIHLRDEDVPSRSN